MPEPPDIGKASFLLPTYHRHQAILITASLRSLTYRTTAGLPALALNLILSALSLSKCSPFANLLNASNGFDKLSRLFLVVPSLQSTLSLSKCSSIADYLPTFRGFDKLSRLIIPSEFVEHSTSAWVWVFEKKS